MPPDGLLPSAAEHADRDLDTPSPAEPELRRLDGDPQQRYWVSAPHGWHARRSTPRGLLVSVHGISRNAGAHARTLAALADEVGLVLVAPHFSRSRFPDYQRIGRCGRLGPGGRADHMLLRIAKAVCMEYGLRQQPFLLMGHSGGAQFALRFALVHSAQVAAYALSAPGSYCWPGTGRRFPHGTASSQAFSDLRPDLDALLQRPGLVLVGARDVERDAALRQGERIDTQQGRNRVERAQRWVAAMQKCAAQRGMVAPLTLHAVADCGHGFSELARSPAWHGAVRRHLAFSLARLNCHSTPPAPAAFSGRSIQQEIAMPMTGSRVQPP
jgi:poly(3-hydroxybutyrate) depolymerase